MRKEKGVEFLSIYIILFSLKKYAFFSWEAWWKFCMNAWQPRAPYSLKQNRKLMLLKHFMMNFKLGKGQPDSMHSLNNWFSPENALPPRPWVTLQAAKSAMLLFSCENPFWWKEVHFSFVCKNCIWHQFRGKKLQLINNT